MSERKVCSARGRQTGAALLEFAILTPLLVILLLGLVEFGRALMQTNSLTKAVTTGARFVARAPGAVTSGCVADNSVGIWDAAVAQAELLVEKDNAGSGEVILPGLDETGAITFSVGKETVTFGGGTDTIDVCVITVRAETPFGAILGDTLVPFFQLGPITIHAQAEERYIGE